MNPKNELQVINTSSFLPAIAGDIGAVVKKNLGGGALTAFDLTRVHVPSGGATTWEMGDVAAKVIEGVIIFTANTRRYYHDTFTPGVSLPPDCLSTDLLTGVGTPGGDCLKCPLNQWKTAVDAKGQPAKGKACGQYQYAYVKVSDGGILPIILVVPPSSLRAYRLYMVSLSNQGLVYDQVVTSFTLVKGDGLVSEMAFATVGKVDEQLAAYIKAIQPVLEGLPLSNDSE